MTFQKQPKFRVTVWKDDKVVFLSVDADAKRAETLQTIYGLNHIYRVEVEDTTHATDLF